MNDIYIQLEFISLLLTQGYSLQDIVSLLHTCFHTKEIIKLEQCLETGKSMEQALLESYQDSSFQEYFPFFLKRNNISKSIEQTLFLCKKQREMISSLRKQLQYPLFLLVFLFFFSIFVSCFLLPQVRNMITSFGSCLTIFQEIIFFLFQIIPAIVFIFLLIMIGLGTYIIYCIHRKNQSTIQYCLTIPLLGSVLKKYYSLKFAFYYNELLQTGYDSSKVIEFLYHYLKSHDLFIILYPMKNKIEQGTSFESFIEDSPYFEPLFIQYVYIMQKQVGLKNLNEYIELSKKMMERNIQRILLIIIPCIYCFVALFVVFVYLSVILPLMNVIEGV